MGAVERVRNLWVAGMLMSVALIFSATTGAQAETRSLKIHFTHTGERGEVVYKRNGTYVQEGLRQINHLLRDWRRNEPTNMDPRLLDLLWEVYRQSGSRAYIHVISAYRSPATNQMLRSRSSGVAENSQHTRGKAIDFFLPDVPLQRLRNLGLQNHGGGVGYYPGSGSPFVHLDTGSVRHWPRMNRQQLMAVFPNGGTIHVPSDGRPLPGYDQAMAAYQSRQRGQGSIQVASGSASASSGGGGLLAALFGGGAGLGPAQAEMGAGTPTTSQARPSQPVQTAAATPAASAARPAATPPAAAPRQAEPRPETTPATILAALPAERMPVPVFAPRPSVPVGTAAAQPAVESPAAPAAQEPAAGPTLVAAAAPVPFEVRDSLPTADETAAIRETQVAALGVPLPIFRPQSEATGGTEGATTLAALAPVQSAPGGSSAIEGLLSARARADRLPNVPTPADRPVTVAAADPDGAMVLLASLPTPEARLADPEVAADAAALKERAVASIRDERLSTASTGTSPRVAVLSRDLGTDAVAALNSGVRTTSKAPRPGAQDVRRRSRDPQVLPVQGEHARWAFEAASVTMITDGTRAPSYAYAHVMSAPRTVYTAGFQEASPGEMNRFSGQAVQFLSVARFATN